MTLFNYYYYYCGLFLIVYTKYLLANKCNECDGMIFNDFLTADHVPPPTRGDCEIASTDGSCSVRITWFKHSATEVYYGSDSHIPTDSIVVKTERRVTTWSGEYETRRHIIYKCKPSNTTPCNTVENLKQAIASVTFPTDEQMKKFDTLIVPTTDFDGRLCLNFSNTTNCNNINLVSCQQCIGIIQYSEHIDICATCPANKALANFLEYETTFQVHNQTRSDVIRLGCRKRGACNSIENIEKIKKTLVTQFDFHKFSSSTAASITLSTTLVLIMPIIMRLAR
ncbi:unnamed protein product [Adineta steineri]|uniref:Uncharacterized protein n=1 Tax=Adineta steineri TaxID=433720 RepID=A0A815V081_9BILA|nr:unnamed protein product [Adineta steineri]